MSDYDEIKQKVIQLLHIILENTNYNTEYLDLYKNKSSDFKDSYYNSSLSDNN